MSLAKQEIHPVEVSDHNRQARMKILFFFKISFVDMTHLILNGVGYMILLLYYFTFLHSNSI